MQDDFSASLDAFSPSPNYGPRRGRDAPSLIVVHYTGMPSFEGARERLSDPAAEVSAHYLISGEGRVFGMVGESRRAWHAGRSNWLGIEDVNSASIGVELAHAGGEAPRSAPPFPEPQMAALERVLRAAMARWSIPPEGVVGHSDVAPGRKIDPGESFDWARLARRGLARPSPGASEAMGAASGEAREAWEARFLSALRGIGYGDWPLGDLLDAFRRRWRPASVAFGGAAVERGDLALAEALAAEL